MYGLRVSLLLALVGAAGCEGTIAGPGGSGAGADAAGGAPADAADAPADANAGGAPTDAALPPPDAESGVLTLASRAGCFFAVTDTASTYELSAGESGAQYRWITIDYHTTHGGWREDVFDRPVLNHGLFGLTRNVGDFVGRYILGNAAQIKPPQANLDRKSVFYGRVDLEPRPQGEGWMGYTSWRDDTAWQVGQGYDVHITLDAVGRQQHLEVWHDGTLISQVTGDIAYFEPSLSEATYTLTFGGQESADREVKPLGWEFCDLTVRAELL